MGLFTTSTKANGDRVVKALWTYRHAIDEGGDARLYARAHGQDKTEAARLFEEMQAEILDALGPVRIDHRQVCNMSKLMMANNIDRALKLVSAARSDSQLHWPWALLLNLVLLPFRLIGKLLKLVIP